MERRIEEMDNQDANVYVQAMTEPLTECTFSVVSDAFDGAAPADVFVAFLVDGAVAGHMVVRLLVLFCLLCLLLLELQMRLLVQWVAWISLYSLKKGLSCWKRLILVYPSAVSAACVGGCSVAKVEIGVIFGAVAFLSTAFASVAATGLMMMVDPPGGGLLRGAAVSIDISVCRFGSAWFWGGNRWNLDWKFEFDSRLVGS
ncbi:hypothetical protein Ancab_021184 [Ancistrocladus abbreviatus]